MTEKIPSLENSNKERLLFVCKNLQNLAKYHEDKIAKLEMKVERLERENTELERENIKLTLFPLAHTEI